MGTFRTLVVLSAACGFCRTATAQTAAPAPYAPPPPAYYSSTPPPAPPQRNDPSAGAFRMPPWSVRIDPFNWLLEGRLGIQLEAGITDWLSAELVPVFVTDGTPPTLDSYTDRASSVSQSSNGLGPLSGTSIGAGFWLGGHVFQGYVLRAIFTNYGYGYRTSDDNGGLVDRLSHTDRQLIGMIGSVSTFGVFTIAGDFGLGVDLNHETRCVDSSHCDGLELTLGNGTVVDVAPSFYPVVIAARFSFGVTFQ